MSEFVRSAGVPFSVDTVIDPDIHNEEHDNIATAIADNDDRLDDLETANISYNGIKTWLAIGKFQVGLNSNDIYELSTGTGIRVNSYLKMKPDQLMFVGTLADQTAEDALTGVADGAMAYRSDLDKFRGYEDGQWKNMITVVNTTLDPAFIDQRYRPRWASTSTIVVPAGSSATDNTGNYLITLATDITVSTGSTGAAGLDAGSVSNSTHYYPYLIGSSSNANAPSVVLSTEADPAIGPVLPAGYDIYRRLNVAYTTNGSAQLLKTFIAGGWPYMTRVRYNVAFGSSRSGAGENNILFEGLNTSFTPVDASAFVPEISTIAVLKAAIGKGDNSATTAGFIRAAGESHDGYKLNEAGYYGRENYEMEFESPTSTSQGLEYKKTGSVVVGIWVTGYVVTEVA